MRRVVDALSHLAGLVAAILLTGLIFLTGADVAWRNFQGRSIAGVYEYSEIILVGVVFLSLAWAQRSDAHVSVDLFTRALPDAMGRTVRAVGIAVALTILVWMGVESMSAAWESWVSGEYRIGLAEVPVWPARFAVAFGMLLLILQLLLNLADLVRPGSER